MTDAPARRVCGCGVHFDVVTPQPKFLIQQRHNKRYYLEKGQGSTPYIELAHRYEHDDAQRWACLECDVIPEPTRSNLCAASKDGTPERLHAQGPAPQHSFHHPIPSRDMDHVGAFDLGAIPHDTGDRMRKDDGKPRFDLLPPEPLFALSELYAFGAKKYAARGWEEGMHWGRCFGALMRHAWKWARGEDYDEETGAHHMIAVAWNAFAIYTYAVRGIGKDDRARTLLHPGGK